MSATAAPQPRSQVIADWIVAEFADDSMIDLGMACAVVMSRIAIGAGETRREAQMLGGSFKQLVDELIAIADRARA